MSSIGSGGSASSSETTPEAGGGSPAASMPAASTGAASTGPIVWVLGDIHVDTAIYHVHPAAVHQAAASNDKQRYHEGQTNVVHKKYYCGAWLLQDILAEVFGDAVRIVSWWHPERDQGAAGVPTDLTDRVSRTPQSSYSVAPFRRNPKKDESSATDLVYRIRESIGWDKQSAASPLKNDLIRGGGDALKEPPALVVLYDRNNGFRSSEVAVELTSRLKEMCGPAAGGPDAARPSVVWFRSYPFKDGDPLSQSLCHSELRDRTAVIVRAEDLRNAGVNVIQEASVEQLVESLFAERQQSALRELLTFRHLIIYFREGTLHLSPGASPEMAAYHFCPNIVDEMWLPPPSGGQMRGYTTILTGAVAAGVCADLLGKVPWVDPFACGIEELGRHFGPPVPAAKKAASGPAPPPVPGLVAGIQLGQVLGAHHHRSGYGVPKDLDDLKKADCKLRSPIPHLFKNGNAKDENFVAKGGVQSTKPDYKLSSITFDRRTSPRLSRVDAFLASVVSNRNCTAEDVLVDVVRYGLSYVVESADSGTCAGHALKAGAGPGGLWTPVSEVWCPFAEFGKLQTCDRGEIDPLMSVYSLMYNYYHHGERDRPFSLAVFGPPGSGKSFGIKQLVGCIDRKAAEAALEYNLAQFSQVEDLVSVFHHVHDRGTSDVVPLVIIDEFDCPFQGRPLGWLKYFLAPMQDGTFKDRGDVYKVGRAIFLFSGGTAHTYREFVEEQPSDAEFRAAKGPDFVSRLRGYLDIRSINAGRDGVVSNELKTRRAILLRSIIQLRRKNAVRQETGEARIEKELCRAFLNVGAFKHGVRSMEAIVEMSAVRDGALVKSSLPLDSQLSIHVDPKEFVGLMDG